ncbi:MAG: TolC family outer membrane protein [Alphaproteobacteria bacterium]|jgi:TolC family type I secretion outer membrane protein|nr:TolC family outer membrane protein [Alphaproteobacteria bacterium]
MNIPATFAIVMIPFLSLVAAVLPAQVRAQSLEEALATAYATNPALLAERAALRATDEGVARALSGWRPTVTVNGQFDHQFTDSETRFLFSAGEQTIDTKSIELSLSQPLYRGGRTVSDTQRSENLVLAGRANLIDIEQQVLLDGTIAYMNVVRDQAVVELSINNERVLGRQLEATRDRFEVGEVTRTDVSQAEARLSNGNAVRIEAEGALAIARANYLAVIGDLPGQIDFPTADNRPLLPDSQEEALRLSRARHPALIRAGFLERAALYDISYAGGRLLPEVTFDTSISRALDPTTFTDEQDSFQFGVTGRVPLYQSGDEYAEIRQLRQTAAQRRRELDSARRTAEEDASGVWVELQTAVAQIRALEASVRANRIALEGIEQEAAVGARTVLDVLDAEQELFDAQVNLVRARRDEIVAGYELLQVIGSLTAPALRLPVTQYDPAAHYQEVRDKWIGFGSDYNAGALIDLDTEGWFDFLE